MKPESKIPRWTAWARSLAGRHGRRHERLDRLSLQLVRPRTLARAVQQRWFFSSRTVQPRIALAIQPVLRASFWRTPERVERITRTATTSSTIETRTTHREQVREVERYRQTERVFTEQRPALLKVFERLRESRGLTGGLVGRQERAAEATALARTLAARARREEKALPGEPPARVLRPTEPVGREERRDPDPRRPEIPGWGAPTSSLHGLMPIPAPPPINVESLTDQVMRQIDRRVGAWRERTGGF